MLSNNSSDHLSSLFLFSVPPSFIIPPLSQVNGTPHNYVVIFALSSYSSIWVVVLFGYLGLLQIACFILALLNRKITIKAFNDSNEIRKIIYITSFVALEMFILYFAIRKINDAFVSLYLGHLLAGTTAVILITFIPKVLGCNVIIILCLQS